MERTHDIIWTAATYNEFSMIGDAETIAAKIKENASNINQPLAGAANGDSMLHYAAFKGNTLLIKCLIERGADINARNFDLRTPLHRAAMTCRYNAARLLLDLGAIPVLLDKDLMPAHTLARRNPGETPMRTELIILLESAVESMAPKSDKQEEDDHRDDDDQCIDDIQRIDDIQHTDDIQHINKSMPIVEERRSGTIKHNRTADEISYANIACGRSSKSCHALVKSMKDINALIWHGIQSAMHVAARHGNLVVLRALIDNGADVNIRTLAAPRQRGGITPLHFAAQYRNAAAVQLLLDAGADADAMDDHDQIPLKYALNHSVRSRVDEQVQIINMFRLNAQKLKDAPQHSAPLKRKREVAEEDTAPHKKKVEQMEQMEQSDDLSGAKSDDINLNENDIPHATPQLSVFGELVKAEALWHTMNRGHQISFYHLVINARDMPANGDGQRGTSQQNRVFARHVTNDDRFKAAAEMEEMWYSMSVVQRQLFCLGVVDVAND